MNPSSNKRRTQLLIALLLVVFVTVGVVLLRPESQATTSQAPKPAPPPPPSVSDEKLLTMGQQIETAIANYPGVQISVTVTEINTDKSYHYGSNAGFLGASTSKVITATKYLQEVEKGNKSLDALIDGIPARVQMQKMIEKSDNKAWAALNDQMGGRPGLQVWATELGMTNYDAVPNVITTDDIALLLTKLYQRKLLNSANTELLLNHMQLANEGEYIKPSVPSGVKIYHKGGWLSDRVNDVAIIDNGEKPYVLTIFTKVDGKYNTTVGQKIFGEITVPTVNAFLTP